MAADRQLGAILTAMVTPFDADGEMNEEEARRLVRHLVEHGSDGVVVAGTTGESPTLSDDEKLRLLELVLDEVGDEATVVIGTGSNDTAHSVKLTREASRRGAHAALVVTPYYSKPSREGLVAHFRTVADAAEVPVMLYNIPARAVINLDTDLIAEIALVDNVVAIKQANPDLDQARSIVEDAGLALYAGDDNLLRTFAELGAAGGVCVSSHLFGEQMKEMYEAALAGEAERAREIEDGLADVYETIFMTVGIATTKAALKLLGFDVGGLRLPLVEVTEDEHIQVREMLARHGLVASAA